MRGRPNRAQEYREVTILLDVVCAVDPSPIEEHHTLCECEQALRSQLDRYAQVGWQPVGALDFPTLWAEGRVQRRETRGGKAKNVTLGGSVRLYFIEG